MLARDIFAEEIREMGSPLAEAGHFDTSNELPLSYEPLYKHLWVPVSLNDPFPFLMILCFLISSCHLIM